MVLLRIFFTENNSPLVATNRKQLTTKKHQKRAQSGMPKPGCLVWCVNFELKWILEPIFEFCKSKCAEMQVFSKQNLSSSTFAELE
jgi:hypothetical protein